MYTGFRDVLSQTLQREGYFGLYKGLIPTLAKVVPAVSISYVVRVDGVLASSAFTDQDVGPFQVYEHSKRYLHLS